MNFPGLVAVKQAQAPRTPIEKTREACLIAKEGVSHAVSVLLSIPHLKMAKSGINRAGHEERRHYLVGDVMRETKIRGKQSGHQQSNCLVSRTIRKYEAQAEIHHPQMGQSHQD